jgi:peptide methionine sulfoxide reductase msrA/msrB
MTMRCMIRCGLAGLVLGAGAGLLLLSGTSIALGRAIAGITGSAWAPPGGAADEAVSLDELVARSEEAVKKRAKRLTDQNAASTDKTKESSEMGGSTKTGGTTSTTSTTASGHAARMYSRSGFDLTPLTKSEIEELARGLTADERRILLEAGTEKPFCGTLLDNKKQGVYVCKLGGLPLFSSQHKFNSGTGWPSFFQPFDLEHIIYKKDVSHGMTRVEIECARSGAHLGHVFEDGPAPTGLRYCLNSEAMDFIEARADGTIAWPAKPGDKPGMRGPVPMETAYFAGGCFWGVEDRFQNTPGVFSAVSGYQGGAIEKPTYKQICTGDTGHAETVMITFDPTRVSYRQLLEMFFKYHNPTTLNRQGPDIGTQYRSAIFTTDDAQMKAAKAFITEQQATEKYKGKTIVTQVVSVSTAGQFWPAEDYHQDYHEKNGGSCALPE